MIQISTVSCSSRNIILFISVAMVCGCATTTTTTPWVTVEKPKPDIAVIMGKKQSSDVTPSTEGSQHLGDVGILVQVRKYKSPRTEEAAQLESSEEVKSMFDRAGINSEIVLGETDPKLQHLKFLIYAEYSEAYREVRTESHKISGWDQGQMISAWNQGRFYTPPTYYDVSFVREDTYAFTIYNMNTGAIDCCYTKTNIVDRVRACLEK